MVWTGISVAISYHAADSIQPVLSALPGVRPPPESEIEAYTVDFQIRERFRDDETQAFLVDDGERSGEFVRRDGELEASPETYRDHGPGWVRLARKQIAAEHEEESDRARSRSAEGRSTEGRSADDELTEWGELDRE